jgi:hypothetical protein
MAMRSKFPAARLALAIDAPKLTNSGGLGKF